MISIGTSLDSSERAIRLAEQFPSVYAAVGWHPTEAMKAPADLRPALREYAKHPKSSPSVKSVWIITTCPV